MCAVKNSDTPPRRQRMLTLVRLFPALKREPTNRKKRYSYNRHELILLSVLTVKTVLVTVTNCRALPRGVGDILLFYFIIKP